MNGSQIPGLRGRRLKGAPSATRARSRQSGFTLVEVVLASTLTLFFCLSLLETVSICRRMASNVKWRLMADAIAYDTAWDLFNQYATAQSFSDAYPRATNAWAEIPANQAPDWYGKGKAYAYWEVAPVGVPSSNWVIRSHVRWPVGVGKYATNTTCVIERHWGSRKIYLGTD